MNKTYEMILDEMKNAYFEKTGENVMLYSDLGARFQAVASELLSLYHYADFVCRQAFPQSASGEYLDRHAALRGLARKTAVKARGVLTFFVSEAGGQPLTVPAGTLCSVEGKPFLQFVTLEAGEIDAGALQVSVAAEALGAGTEYNVGSHTVTNIVNPLPDIDGVTNEAPFEAGENEESDSALRNRLTQAFRTVSTGVSKAYYQKEIEKLPEVLKCRVDYDAGTLSVCLKTVGNALDEELTQRIRSLLFAAQLLEVPVNVTLAHEVPYTLTVHLTTEKGRGNELLHEAQRLVQEFTELSGIGESVSLEQLRVRLYALTGVKQVACTSPQATGDQLFCGSRELLRAQSFEVSCYE